MAELGSEIGQSPKAGMNTHILQQSLQCCQKVVQRVCTFALELQENVSRRKLRAALKVVLSQDDL